MSKFFVKLKTQDSIFIGVVDAVDQEDLFWAVDDHFNPFDVAVTPCNRGDLLGINRKGEFFLADEHIEKLKHVLESKTWDNIKYDPYEKYTRGE
jgi:hypothetical protein